MSLKTRYPPIAWNPDRAFGEAESISEFCDLGVCRKQLLELGLVPQFEVDGCCGLRKCEMEGEYRQRQSSQGHGFHGRIAGDEPEKIPTAHPLHSNAK
jgi:hypothetical protein